MAEWKEQSFCRSTNVTKQSAAQVSDAATEHSEMEALWGVVGLLLSQLVHAKYMDAKVLRGHLTSLHAPPALPVQRLIDSLDYMIRVEDSNRPGMYHLNVLNRGVR